MRSKKVRTLLLALLVLPVAAILTMGCEVRKTQDGKMPDVDVKGGQLPKYEIDKTQEGKMPDVDVKGGQLPKYDVKPAEVEIGMKDKEITVPDIDINKKKVDISVLDIDIKAPDENVNRANVNEPNTNTEVEPDGQVQKDH